LGTLAVLIVGLVLRAKEVPEDRIDRAELRRRAAIHALGDRVRPLHRTKEKPRPGDWLAKHIESGQSFDAYLDESPVRADERRTTLYVQPLGRLDAGGEKLLRLTADMLGRFYGLPVKTLALLPPGTIPERARRTRAETGETQILTGFVLDLLKTRRPDDAVAVIALTDFDLWPGEGWNFVFGQASLRDRVGVWSFHRFGDPNEEFPVCLQRTLATALHETGHMLSIRHCIAYECGMNGSNNLRESDRRPMAFCPECEMKVWWAGGVDPRARYTRLADFANRNGLKGEEDFWTRSLEALAESRNLSSK
jgi:archaemetzincin